MKKRILAGALAALMLLSLLPMLSYAADPLDEKAVALAALDIMSGDANGDLNLSASLTRAQFAKMAVMAHPTGRYASDASAVSPFYDVPAKHWAAGYVTAARDLGLAKGYLDGLYHPDNTIKLEEAATVLLRLLGYADSDFPGLYPAGQMAAYRSLGLDRGVKATQGQAITRADAQQLFYNLLTCDSKTGGTAYVLSLNANGLSPDGQVNTVALINAAMEGPVVAAANWQSQLNFKTNGNTTYYRNGTLAASTDIQSNDVLYYSDSMRTVWAYTTRVTGTYTAATPSMSSPTSVTVAGKAYTLETNAAVYALSDLSGRKLGDTVTLLLGRTGGVAAVLDGTAASTAAQTYGVITQVTTGTLTDANGNDYRSDLVTITATDGNTYSYPVSSSSYTVGGLLQAVSTNGGLKVSGLGGSSLSGKVNTAGTTLGSYRFAADVQILDTYEDQGIRVYPTRLAGYSIQSSDVRFYRCNTQGEIDRLILKDFTGDMHQYGILTAATEISAGVQVSSVYTYDVGGASHTISLPNKAYGASTGPMVLKTKGGAVNSLKNLTSVSLTSVEGLVGYSSSRVAYPISEQVAVYEAGGVNDYYYSSLDRVNNGAYTLTGYYDASASDGGCIRVILAKAK